MSKEKEACRFCKQGEKCNNPWCPTTKEQDEN